MKSNFKWIKKRFKTKKDNLKQEDTETNGMNDVRIQTRLNNFFEPKREALKDKILEIKLQKAKLRREERSMNYRIEQRENNKNLSCKSKQQH